MKIGYALCGSYCTHARSLAVLEDLVRQYTIVPIVSENAASTDTRFGKAADLLAILESLCGRPPVRTIAEAEPLGPEEPLDLLIIAPCTGNTLAKMAHGITDTAVTMAAKAHLRGNRPLLVALATNDALSANLQNIAVMKNRKNVYFTPMSMDDPENKPHSLVADFRAIPAEAKRLLAEGRNGGNL
ncbi:MAG: dipicolinate synthase subunit B [Clostridia bacterium]|nr:dipicolinate synthase subunit B [Clostridia bacterium]